MSGSIDHVSMFLSEQNQYLRMTSVNLTETVDGFDRYWWALVVLSFLDEVSGRCLKGGATLTTWG